MSYSLSIHRSIARSSPRAGRAIVITLIATAITITVADAAEKPAKSTTEATSAKRDGKSSAKKATVRRAKPKKPEITMDQFLDRLMVAESNGNDRAKNPLSTATGAYQFIESTFLSVMRRHFPKRIEKLNAKQILALRTVRDVARNAAKAYTKDNATHLAAAGHKPTFPHLRLAFLLGAGGANRILSAKPATPLVQLLSPGVIRANPWMARHTARSLIARAARDISLPPNASAGVKPRIDPVTGKLILPKHIASQPRIKVRCNLARPSCKRWLALKRKQLARPKSKKRVAQSRR